jgi:hypothetical protein
MHSVAANLISYLHILIDTSGGWEAAYQACMDAFPDTLVPKQRIIPSPAVMNLFMNKADSNGLTQFTEYDIEWSALSTGNELQPVLRVIDSELVLLVLLEVKAVLEHAWQLPAVKNKQPVAALQLEKAETLPKTP